MVLKKSWAKILGAILCTASIACLIFFAVRLFTASSKLTQNPLQIGESAVINDLQLTVNGYEFSDYAGALEGLRKSEDGFRYCVVYVSVKNVGSKAVQIGGTFNNSNFSSKLVFDNDYEYNSMWLDHSEFFYAHDSIPALGEIDCCFCFTIADDVEIQRDKSLLFEFGLNKIGTTEKAVWALR